MPEKKSITPRRAAPPAGPYSTAIEHAGLVYVSGQVPRDPVSGSIVKGSISDQARQMMDNIADVLEAAEIDFSSVVKTTLFLTNMKDFGDVNKVYAEYFPAPYPARSCVEISALPLGASMEIELVASKATTESN